MNKKAERVLHDLKHGPISEETVQEAIDVIEELGDEIEGMLAACESLTLDNAALTEVQ